MRTKGFSLIELLIVISIIGVLSAVALFALGGVREQARDAKRKTDLENMRSAFELYKSDCKVYPTSPLPAPGSSLVGPATIPSCANNVYLQAIPDDPTSTYDYRYARLTTTTYELCADLEGGTGTQTCGGLSTCGGGTCNYKVVSP